MRLIVLVLASAEAVCVAFARGDGDSLGAPVVYQASHGAQCPLHVPPGSLLGRAETLQGTHPVYQHRSPLWPTSILLTLQGTPAVYQHRSSPWARSRLGISGAGETEESSLGDGAPLGGP